MTQSDLDRQVSRRTGESLSTVRGMGFVPLTPTPYECESRPNVVDWDEVDAQRVGLFPSGRRRSA
ncbi:MAG: hypothetical protein K8T91_06815 [Planctomycetes bacterium]|nr:hypothetical protein [Planctomycetota bacterium]